MTTRRAPPVGLVVAAAVDLLLVDPVQLAVERVLAAAGGQANFVAFQVDDVEVRVAYEGEAPAVGREARQFLGLRPVSEPRQRLGVEVPDEQVRGEFKQQPVGGRRQAQRARPRPGSRVLTVQPELFFQGLGQRLRVVERLCVSGCRVDERPGPAGVVRVVFGVQIVAAPRQPADPGQVGREVERVRSVDVVEFEGLRLRRRRCEAEGGYEGSEKTREG